MPGISIEDCGRKMGSLSVISQAYIDRMCQLSQVLGHVGVRLLDVSKTRSRSDVTNVLQRVIWPTVYLAESVKLHCSKRDAGNTMVKSVISGGGPYDVDIQRACSAEHIALWTGEVFSHDQTIALEMDWPKLQDAPIIVSGADPFVMENLRSFLGKRGLNLVTTLASSQQQKVVIALVGGLGEAFLFARRDLMTAVVSLVYKKCRASEAYKRFTAGPFVPTEQVLARLAKRKR